MWMGMSDEQYRAYREAKGDPLPPPPARRVETVEVQIGRHRAVEIEQLRWEPDDFSACLLDDAGEVVASANGETPSEALRALALVDAPEAPGQPSLAGMRRREMAPRDREERARMIWAFREATRRMRKVMKHAGFELQSILGILGDETMAQRCIPRPATLTIHHQEGE